MLSVTLRAADAYTHAAPPLAKPVIVGQRKRSVIGTVIGLAVMFAVVALVILTRVSAYTVTHGYQPLLEPLRRLFG